MKIQISAVSRDRKLAFLKEIRDLTTGHFGLREAVNLFDEIMFGKPATVKVRIAAGEACKRLAAIGATATPAKRVRHGNASFRLSRKELEHIAKGNALLAQQDDDFPAFEHRINVALSKFKQAQNDPDDSLSSINAECAAEEQTERKGKPVGTGSRSVVAV